MGLGIIGDAVDAVGDGLDKAKDVAEDVADEVGDAVVKVGETAYNVTKEFADKVAEMAKYVMGFTDEALEKVIKLLNLPWPEADEGKLRELANAYTAMANTLDQVRVETWKQTASVTANNKGPAIDDLAGFWSRYDTGFGGGWLAEAAKGCRAQATFLNESAKFVEDAKRTMRIEILAVAATILAGVGLSIATAGAASGAAASASASVVAACGAAAGTLTASIITAAVTAGIFAIQGALVAIVVDVAVTQPVRLAAGTQDGFNVKEVFTAAAFGAGAGAAGSAFSIGVSQLPKIAPTLQNTSTLLASSARNAPKVFNSVPGQTVFGAGTAAMMNVVTDRPVTLADLAFGAAGGAGGAKAAKVVLTPKGPKGALPVDLPETNLTSRPGVTEGPVAAGRPGAPGGVGDTVAPPPSGGPRTPVVPEGTAPPERAISIKSNHQERPGGTTYGDLSPKTKSLYRSLLGDRGSLTSGLSQPVSRGEVGIQHLAELQSFAPREFAIVQNPAGDMRILTGDATWTNIPPDLEAQGFKFILHTHPEDGAPGSGAVYGETHTMTEDLATKASDGDDHVEVVVSRNGQYTYFDKNGFVIVPEGSRYHPEGALNPLGFVVPVPGIGPSG